MPGLSSLLPDNIDRDFHRRNRPPVLKPVRGVPVLGPAHSWPIIRSNAISMVSDRSLQYVDDAWPVLMVVNRAEDASRLHGHHPHSKLAPCHPLDLRPKVNRCQQLRRNTLRLRCRLFVAHRALLSALPGPDVRPSTEAVPHSWPPPYGGPGDSSVRVEAVKGAERWRSLVRKETECSGLDMTRAVGMCATTRHCPFGGSKRSLAAQRARRDSDALRARPDVDQSWTSWQRREWRP
jgi:hypothetical protein